MVSASGLKSRDPFAECSQLGDLRVEPTGPGHDGVSCVEGLGENGEIFGFEQMRGNGRSDGFAHIMDSAERRQTDSAGGFNQLLNLRDVLVDEFGLSNRFDFEGHSSPSAQWLVPPAIGARGRIPIFPRCERPRPTILTRPWSISRRRHAISALADAVGG
jgi:hypothetical protein